MSGETNITSRDAGSVAQGLGAMWVAVASFSIADAIGKWGGGEGFAAVQIVFFRYLFGLVPLALVLWWNGFEAVRTARPWAHALRGLLLSAALALFFWGLKYVPLADGIAVAFTAPLFITALSVPVLGERVGPARWLAVLVGFAGMLVIVQPGTGSFRPEMAIIVASAFVFALGMVVLRFEETLASRDLRALRPGALATLVFSRSGAIARAPASDRMSSSPSAMSVSRWRRSGVA